MDLDIILRKFKYENLSLEETIELLYKFLEVSSFLDNKKAD